MDKNKQKDTACKEMQKESMAIDFSSNSQEDLEIYKKALKLAKENNAKKNDPDNRSHNAQRQIMRDEILEKDDENNIIYNNKDMEGIQNKNMSIAEYKKDPTGKNYSRRKNVHTVIYIIGLCIIVGIVIFIFRGGNSDKTDKAVINGILGTQGALYFPDGSGNMLMVNGDYRMGYITPDRNRMILNAKNGDVFMADGKGENPKLILQGVSYISYRTNEGFIYVTQQNNEDNEEVYSRYLFREGETLEIGSGRIVVSQKQLQVLYEDDGEVYILREDMNEKELLGKYELARPQEISSDGKWALWSSYISEGASELHYTYNGNVESIGNFEADYMDFLQIIFNKNGQEFVLHYADKPFIILGNKGEIKQLEFEETDSLYLYSKKDKNFEPFMYSYLEEENTITDFYLEAVSTNEHGYWCSELYNISIEGNKDLLISDASVINYLYDNTIYYIDMQENLISADIVNNEVKNRTVKAENVNSAEISNNAEIICYSSTEDHEYKELYVKKGEEQAKKLEKYYQAEDAIILEHLDAVFLYSDKNIVSYYQYGDLYMYTLDGEKILIDNDVLLENLGTYRLKEGGQGFYYKKYLGMENNECVYSYMYFDGEKSYSLVERAVGDYY